MTQQSLSDLHAELGAIRQKLADLEAKQDNSKPATNSVRRRSVTGRVLGWIPWVASIVLISGPVFAQSEDALLIDKEGNVGIGTVSPTHKLNVDGNVNISGTVTAGMGAIPVGMIAMWYGTKPPDGWVLCNGNKIEKGKLKGTNAPDLRGRFIAGHTDGRLPYKGTESDYNKIGGGRDGAGGGEEKVELTVAQMPSHKHGGMTESAKARFTLPYTNSNTGKGVTLWWSRPTMNRQFEIEGHQHGIKPEGEGKAFDNRPPYYVLAFIMYVGE